MERLLSITYKKFKRVRVYPELSEYDKCNHKDPWKQKDWEVKQRCEYSRHHSDAVWLGNITAGFKDGEGDKKSTMQDARSIWKLETTKKHSPLGPPEKNKTLPTPSC